jgi:hypothetical protein
MIARGFEVLPSESVFGGGIPLKNIDYGPGFNTLGSVLGNRIENQGNQQICSRGVGLPRLILYLASC